MLRRGASLWKAGIALLRRWQQRIRTRRAFSQVDDRALDDVGLSREQRNRVREMVLGEMTRRAPGFFGWKVVWAAFLVAVFSWGVGFYGPSVFLPALHATRGWAISSISVAITTHFLSSAVLITYLSEAHRRFGIARVTQAGIAFAAIGIVAWANARQPWQLFPAALLSGTGWAATSGAAINAIVAPWFDTDRPKALSLVFNGSSVDGLIFTPLWVALIGEFGFAVAAVLIGAAMAIILWPATERFLQPQPTGCHAAVLAQSTPMLGRAALLRDYRFITISAAFALGLFAQIGLFAHLLTRLTPELGSGGAAWATSLAAVCAVAGRTILGWLIRGSPSPSSVVAANPPSIRRLLPLTHPALGRVPPLPRCRRGALRLDFGQPLAHIA